MAENFYQPMAVKHANLSNDDPLRPNKIKTIPFWVQKIETEKKVKKDHQRFFELNSRTMRQSDKYIEKINIHHSASTVWNGEMKFKKMLSP